jgi:hypothetical protein
MERYEDEALDEALDELIAHMGRVEPKGNVPLVREPRMS